MDLVAIDMSDVPAASIALATTIVACVAVGTIGWRTWRDWQRVGRTGDAASALLDVHRDMLDETLERAAAQSARMADGGEELADAVGELRRDVDVLQFLLRSIGVQRDRLMDELGDLVLPGDRSGARVDDSDDGDGDGDRDGDGDGAAVR